MKRLRLVTKRKRIPHFAHAKQVKLKLFFKKILFKIVSHIINIKKQTSYTLFPIPFLADQIVELSHSISNKQYIH